MNEFDAAAAQVAGVPVGMDESVSPRAALYSSLKEENEYSRLLQQEAEQGVRASMLTAVDKQPDVEARVRDLARRYKLPIDVVRRNQQDIERRASFESIDYATIARDLPSTSNFLSDPNNAALSHDNVDNMSAIERKFRQIAGGAVETLGMTASGTGVLADIFQRTALNDFASIFLPEPKRGPMGFAPQKPTIESLAGPLIGEGLRQTGGAIKQFARQDVAGVGQKTFGDQVAGGLGQVAGQAVMTKALGPLGPLLLYAQGADAMNEKVQNDNADQRTKDLAVLGGAAVTGATEKWALDKLLGPLAVPVKNQIGAALARIGIGAAAEGGQEFSENLLQDLIQKALTNRDAEINVGTSVGEGGVGAAVGGIVRTIVESALHIKSRGSRSAQKAQQALQDGEDMAQLSQLAQVDKVLKRDPSSFEAFIKQANADSGGNIQDVFIHAETLAQEMGPNLQALTDAVPALREQMEEALATGGDVSIPVEQFLTYVPAEQTQILLPHLRTDADGMSLSEAQTFDQQGVQDLTAEIEAAAQAAETVQPSSVDQLSQVRQSIMGQLQQAGRFTGDVNQAYGDLLTRFFEATAERAGVDVGSLYADYGPRIVSQLGRAPNQLDQSTESGGESFAQDQLSQERRGAFARDMWEVYDQAGKPVGFVQAASKQAAQETAQERYPGSSGVSERPTAVLALLSQADLSTLIHEAGHYFLEVQAELASRPEHSGAFQNDMQTVLNWFGVPDLPTWQGMTLEQKRPYHEQFARGWEAFAFEGESPSVELQGVFQRFRGWLLRVYKSLSALRVDLSPEVRQVFGRMVATEEQISSAEAMRGYRPLFQSAEAAGMTAEEWADYQASGAEATAEAKSNLERRSLRDLQWLSGARSRALKRLQRQHNEWRKAVREEVTAEVNAIPIYAAWRDLARGRTVDGVPVHLSLPELKESHPGLVDKVPANMATNNGAPLDAVAEAYGLDSGDHMVKLLTTVDHPDKVIDAQIDQRMLERYGDLTDTKTIEQAADELIHNEARARFLEREVNALGKAVGNRPIITRAARQYAEESIARKKVREIRPAQFSAAEARAAKAAAQAFKKGDITTAAARKRDQMLQSQLAKVSHRAVGEVARSVDYLSRFDTDATRAAIGSDYADQIDQLLERFDLRKSTTFKTIGRRKSLAEWVESQRQQGLEPNIDEALIADASLVSYKEMTLEELRGLVDTVKNIEHLGRLKQRLLTVQDQRRFDEIVLEVSQSIRDNGGQALAVELEGRSGVVPWLQGVWASHRKISSLARQMDGGKDAGPLWRVLVRGMNEAGNREQLMTEQATEKLAELYKPLLSLPGGLSGAKVHIPEIRASLSRGGRLAVALNWGNSANRQRLMDGEGWTPEQVGAILRTLSATELEFVNSAWEFIDSYWPQIEAKQERVDGIKPEKVQSEPFTLTSSDGVSVPMRGGYYPIKYDSDRSSRAESQEAAEVAKDMLRGAFTRATTRRGHTKARAEVVKRPVRKDLDVITQHITQVVHDLAWHEWLIDANRLLSSKPVDDAIRSHYGPDIVRTLKDDVAGIATGDLVAQDAFTKALSVLRANVTRSTMGLSFTTALLQPFGLTQSMARIGVKPVLRGVARWAGSAARFESSVQWIGEKSDFMRRRSQTFNRELSEIRRKVAGQSKASQLRDGVLFALTTKMQLVADVPTWIGQYEKALSEGRDDATAVALADQAVLDAQGGGQTKDLAEVQRKHPFLTQFYSYFSTTLNLVAESTAGTDFKNPQAVAGWLADMALLVVIPAIAPMLTLSVLRGDDDDDLLKKAAQAQAGYLLGMLVLAREFSGTVSGFPYNGPPVSRVVTDVNKAAVQAEQGDMDEPAVLAVVRLLGTAFGVPTVQAIRSYRGWEAWSNGDAPVTSVLFGPPSRN